MLPSATSDRSTARGWKTSLLAAPSLLLVALFVGLPLLSAAWHSLFAWDGQTTHGFVALGNYARVLGDSTFWSSVGTVLALVIANVLKLGVTAGVALALHRVRGSQWQPLYLALLVLPIFVPGLVTLLVWRGFFAPQGGLINVLLDWTHLKGFLVHLFPASIHPGEPIDWLHTPGLLLSSLILWGFPWVSVPGVLFFLWVLRPLNPAVYQTANLDCVAPAQVFRHVELPLLVARGWPAAALVAVGTVQGFALQYLLVGRGGPASAGEPPGVWMIEAAFTGRQFGVACAAAMLIVAVLLAATYALRRSLRPLFPSPLDLP